MKNLFVAAGIFAALSFSALADDHPSRRNPPVFVQPLAAIDWSGFYAGANAGAAGGGSPASILTTPLFANPGLSTAGLVQAANDVAGTNALGTGSRLSAILGGQIGYNYQFANDYILGIEADAAGMPSSSNTYGINGYSPLVGFPNVIASTSILTKKEDYIGTVRARFGYLIKPELLIYATGGFAYGGVSASTSTTDNFLGASTAVTPYAAFGGRSALLTGYAVGGGMEYMIAPHWSVKIEGLYYDLGSMRYAGSLALFNTFGTLATIDTVTTRVRYNGEIVRLGVNYHFN